ncbi:hypothetical protein [Streptomyces sp. enrichment culture]|uniref:hypothetical protein n=1 Tax=Streptomyces sp. enrichment culture TaxID=1795815 RepID=UPI003F558905
MEEDLGHPSWGGRPAENPLRAAFAERMRTHHGRRLDPAPVREFTDINQGLQTVLNVATRPGDGAVVHTPAYPPFLETIAGMGRHPHAVPIPQRPQLGRPASARSP